MVLGCYVKGVTYSADLWKRIAPYIDVLGATTLQRNPQDQPRG